MLDTAATPRERRRHQTRLEILEAAWELSHEDGLAALSLRKLAERVGMRAPSLYSYFDGKREIYDAMFQQGQEQFAETMAPFERLRPVTRPLLKRGLRAFCEFCTSDPVRYQLLFQRTLPGFEPSAESYAIAGQRLEAAGSILIDAGITDQGALDLWTALLTGLTSEQISNDPGGNRWTRLLDEAVDMYLDHLDALPEHNGETA